MVTGEHHISVGELTQRVDATLDLVTRSQQRSHILLLLRRQLPLTLRQGSQNVVGLPTDTSLPGRDVLPLQVPRRELRIVGIAGEREVELTGQPAQLPELVELRRGQLPRFHIKRRACHLGPSLGSMEKIGQQAQRVFPGIALVGHEGLQHTQRMLDIVMCHIGHTAKQRGRVLKANPTQKLRNFDVRVDACDDAPEALQDRLPIIDNRRIALLRCYQPDLG